MGILKVPRVRMYWSHQLSVDVITDAVSRDRFFELRSHLHFADRLPVTEEETKKNSLFLVKSVIFFFQESIALRFPVYESCV